MMKIERLLLVIGIFLLPVFSGCAAAISGAVPSFSVSAAEAQTVWEKQQAVIVDVRTVPEYEERHIPGATFIPLDQLPQRFSEVPKQGNVLIICRSGSRSNQAVALLREKGYSNVQSVTGGMLDWQGSVVRSL
jgi:rhodanese-related sulfurtransferase